MARIERSKVFFKPPNPLQKRILGGLIFLQILCAPGWAGPTSNPWAKVNSATPGPAESIGTPTAGCLKGGVSLPRKGKGFKLARPERRRNFGHPELVDLLRRVAQDGSRSKYPPLLIGDLAQARGGPTLSAHASHQSGLDADLYFSRSSRALVNPPSMVDDKKLEVSRSFGKLQIETLKQFAESEKVDRLLVHFTIKRALCKKFPNEKWIRKVRPWFGHSRHFHIRIHCPEKSPLCQQPDPIPDGNGCDATLEWWWSDEARQDEGKNLHRQQNPVMPELPQACAPLLIKT
jgi:penicillin-insensitive murein endopeptidase